MTFFFPLHKVACNATTTCNSHGSCTYDGGCQCDNGFYATDCSGKLSLHYQIIKIFFAILNSLFDQLSVMLPKTVVVKESVDLMELVNVTLGFTCRIVQVSKIVFFFENCSDLNCEKNCYGNTKNVNQRQKVKK